MPAAAVIPAPRVYIKAVAIKTLVVYVMVLFVVLCVRPCFQHGLADRMTRQDRWCSLEIVLGWTIRKNWMEYFEQNRTIEVDRRV